MSTGLLQKIHSFAKDSPEREDLEFDLVDITFKISELMSEKESKGQVRFDGVEYDTLVDLALFGFACDVVNKYCLLYDLDSTYELVSAYKSYIDELNEASRLLEGE